MYVCMYNKLLMIVKNYKLYRLYMIDQHDVLNYYYYILQLRLMLQYCDTGC